jgi:hypothetical protein
LLYNRPLEKSNRTRRIKIEWDANVNLMGENLNTTKENRSLLVCKEFGIRVNAEAMNNMLMSVQQKAGQTRNTEIANISFDCVAKSEYLGITQRNLNCLCKESESRLNLSTASYIWFQIFCLSICHLKT